MPVINENLKPFVALLYWINYNFMKKHVQNKLASKNIKHFCIGNTFIYAEMKKKKKWIDFQGTFTFLPENI